MGNLNYKIPGTILVDDINLRIEQNKTTINQIIINQKSSIQTRLRISTLRASTNKKQTQNALLASSSAKAVKCFRRNEDLVQKKIRVRMIENVQTLLIVTIKSHYYSLKQRSYGTVLCSCLSE